MQSRSTRRIRPPRTSRTDWPTTKIGILSVRILQLHLYVAFVFGFFLTVSWGPLVARVAVMSFDLRKEHLEHALRALKSLEDERRINSNFGELYHYYVPHLYLVCRIVELEEQLFRQKDLEMPSQSVMLRVAPNEEFRVLVHDIQGAISSTRRFPLAIWLLCYLTIKTFVLVMFV